MWLASLVIRKAKLGYGKHHGVVLSTTKEVPTALDLRAPESQIAQILLPLMVSGRGRRKPTIFLRQQQGVKGMELLKTRNKEPAGIPGP